MLLCQGDQAAPLALLDAANTLTTDQKVSAFLQQRSPEKPFLVSALGDARPLCAVAAELLINRLAGQRAGSRTLAHTLVIRDSA